MNEPFDYNENPLMAAYVAVKAHLFSNGYEAFIKSVTSFEPSDEPPSQLKSTAEHLAAWLSETGISIDSWNSHAIQVSITYEVLFNSGILQWSTQLYNANWWLLCRAVEAQLNSIPVIVNGQDLVTSVTVTDIRSGVVPQQTAGKYNLIGWNSMWQIRMSLDIPLISMKPLKEL